MRRHSAILVLLRAGIFVAGIAVAQTGPDRRTKNIESFEVAWRTIRDRDADPTLNGLDWQAVHDELLPQAERATSEEELRTVVSGMLARLGASHHSVIPADRYDAGSADGFGNLPTLDAGFEAHRLDGGVGYIRLHGFVQPGEVMPKLAKAVRDFAKAPGIILDLRGNPGGIGIMATGVAGFFTERDGLSLGRMTMRGQNPMNFVVFPQPGAYPGPLAVVLDSGSASTTEIFAAGMQDLGRARIFGVRSAGAALPSEVIVLPNGDRLQYATATYTSASGRTLERNGVVPDEVVAGDPLEAATRWILRR